MMKVGEIYCINKYIESVFESTIAVCWNPFKLSWDSAVSVYLRL
jgi:hypothetical protein